MLWAQALLLAWMIVGMSFTLYADGKKGESPWATIIGFAIPMLLAYFAGGFSLLIP
jgi:hypothetical protein